MDWGRRVTVDTRSSGGRSQHVTGSGTRDGTVVIHRRWRPAQLVTRQTSHRVTMFVTSACTMLTFAVIVASLAWWEGTQLPSRIDWGLFALAAAALLLGESSRRCWIQVSGRAPITPLRLSAFGLLLLGSPSGALGVALAGSLAHSRIRRSAPLAALLRAATIGITLGSAALVLISFGPTSAPGVAGTISWQWVALATVAGGTILLVNGVVTSIHDAIGSRTPLVTALRRGVGAHITAEGALLSLAPIWIVGLNFSITLLPLLAVTTVLVFRSTKHAVERSHEARHDPLTGLGNRRAFLEQVEDAFGGFGGAATGAVLLIDLDRFKEINDELGHEVGDALLVAFADRLLHTLPRSAVSARLGGDEFAVLLPLHVRSDGSTGHDHQLESLRSQLAEPLTVAGFPVSVDASIGVAFAPRHGRSPSDLLRAADVAMYRAKRLGTSIERYDDCIKIHRRGSIELLSDIGEALDDHQFRIHFQPQLRMGDLGVDTLEALIRWQHPVHGEIQPADFIGLIEQTDLIGPVTELVLRMSIHGMQITNAHDVRLAVNVSARSLQDRYFSSLVFTVLSESGFPAERLEIEVTERALATQPEQSSYTIERLRSAGVSVAIDDFGTGYSSFETLRQLPVDRVKIDGVFVGGLLTNHRDRVIVETVIDLGHRLGLDVIAEGVESTDTWDVLHAMGCDIAQGFGIARPMAFPDLRGWLTRWNEIRIERIDGVEPPVPGDVDRSESADLRLHQ